MTEPASTTRDLALVGAGYWGRNLARNFNDLGALHTLCDANQATLDSYRQGYDAVRKCTSIDALRHDSSIRKVVIAAPALLHYSLAKAALEADKDVFVEKPLCLDEREGEELVALARKHGAVLMVGHLLHYHPCIQRIQSLLAAGELGKLHYITSNRLNLGRIRREENSLWSFAPHDLSVILSLVGHQPPEQIRCLGEAYLNSGIVDTTLTTLRFRGGVRAHVYVSWLNPFKEQKLTVVGSRGMVVFDDRRPWSEKLMLHQDYLTWTDGTDPIPSAAQGVPLPVEEVEPLRSECQHFLDCCRDRTTPRTDGNEGLRVLRVLQLAQQSLERDGEAMTIVGSARRSPDSDLTEPSSPPYFAHPTAVIDDGAVIGNGTKIWHFSHIMSQARIGADCVLGQNTAVAPHAEIGPGCRIQNNVSIYTGVTLEKNVFCGPSCVFTNVYSPRAFVSRKEEFLPTHVGEGTTIGANATIVCGTRIGRFALIGAGAVVRADVPDHAIMAGVPARQVGWACECGEPLKKLPQPGHFLCKRCQSLYAQSGQQIAKQSG